MKNKIVIIGIGETAKLAYEYFTYDSKYEVVSFSADREYIKINEDHLFGIRIIPIDELQSVYPPSDYFAFVAVSSGGLNYERTYLYKRIKSFGYTLVSYISSKAFVWHNVEIGDNCFILEDNTLQPFTKIGNNVVMWSGNHLGHRSVIEDNCFITSHVVISGFCKIGHNTFIGVNTSIADSVNIGCDNFISLGAVINKNTPDNVVLKTTQSQYSIVTAKKLCKVKE